MNRGINAFMLAEKYVHVILQMTKHFAFTLAEVLITLGVIGVVAAMTIPGLINKINERHYQAQYRKAYSTLNQALKMMLDDGYTIDTRNPGASFQKDGAVGDSFKILSNYFTGATRCFDNNADKCWVCENGQSGLASNNWKGCSKRMPAFIDASGIAYYIYAGNEWPVLVDVNGFSGPNELGRDRYVLYFTNSKNKSYYTDDVDIIYPWKDVTVKQRWCPSGDCPNTGRLFGNRGNSYNIDMDKKN